MNAHDISVLRPILEEIKNRPAHWEWLRRMKFNESKQFIGETWHDDLEQIERKYKINILLPVTFEQLEQRAKLLSSEQSAKNS